jgi:hypothetical protein
MPHPGHVFLGSTTATAYLEYRVPGPRERSVKLAGLVRGGADGGADGGVGVGGGGTGPQAASGGPY